MKTILKTALICCLFMTHNLLYSQVGVNTDVPNKLVELDIKNLMDEDGKVIPKGIMIPRMTEADRNRIDVSAANNPNGLMIYNIDEDCYNYYSKTDREWKSLCGKLGKAQFEFDCSAVVALGEYVEKQELTASNKLKISLVVSKPGSYDITGTTTNGYFFSTSGTFLTGGTYTIYADGLGTPNEPTTDVVTFSKNGVDVNCTTPFTIKVMSNIAKYSLNCSSFTVNGAYIKGRQLDATNTITLNVMVSTAGSYSITTPQTNGITFSGSGMLAVGTQQITLVATGTPTVNLDFPITINANTDQGNATCSVMVPVTLPKMTYAIIGGGVWSWNTPARLQALSNTGMGTDVSFGPNGKVRIESFTSLWVTSSVSTAISNLNNNPVKPDIVLYFAFGANPTTAMTNALINYIDKGGCVIYGSSDGTASAVNILMLGLFGVTTAPAQAQIAGSPAEDNVYPIANLPNDPVINGPFGNLSGRYWGEDNLSVGSVIMTELPPNSVQICSAYTPLGKPGVDPEYSIVWYNESKNFLYIGDSTGASNIDKSTSLYPSYFTSSGLPLSKKYGYNVANQQYVYNAALELNAIAWAIKKAAVSGINPH